MPDIIMVHVLFYKIKHLDIKIYNFFDFYEVHVLFYKIKHLDIKIKKIDFKK